MAQVTAIPSARTPRGTPGPQDERMGVLAYLLQGSAFMVFLLLLFVLAGFRG